MPQIVAVAGICAPLRFPAGVVGQVSVVERKAGQRRSSCATPTGSPAVQRRPVHRHGVGAGAQMDHAPQDLARGLGWPVQLAGDECFDGHVGSFSV